MTEVYGWLDSIKQCESIKESFAKNHEVSSLDISVFLVDNQEENNRLSRGEKPPFNWSDQNEITGLDWKTQDEIVARRYEECLKFSSGIRVKVKVDVSQTISAGRTGVVADKKICGIDPYVLVTMDYQTDDPSKEARFNPEDLEMDIDHDRTDHIVCPYCGCEQTDISEIEGSHSEEETRIDCQKCDKEFSSFCSISFSFSTHTVDFEAENRHKEQEKQRRAKLYEECQKWPPGTRVRIKVECKIVQYMFGRKGPWTGTVANRELCKYKPVVKVILDPTENDNGNKSEALCHPKYIEEI